MDLLDLLERCGLALTIFLVCLGLLRCLALRIRLLPLARTVGRLLNLYIENAVVNRLDERRALARRLVPADVDLVSLSVAVPIGGKDEVGILAADTLVGLEEAFRELHDGCEDGGG
jgi:hypothetical protein